MSDVGRESMARRAFDAWVHALGRLRLRGVDRLGARPVVEGAPYVENLGRIEIGDDVLLRAGDVRSHLVTGPRATLRVGSGVSFGQGAAIAATTSIEIGDGAELGAGVMLMDSDYHGSDDREAPGASDAIVVGPGVRIEERVVVLKGARIGARAHVAAGSVVAGIVAPDAFVSGVPARAVGARSHDADARSLVQRAVAEALGPSRELSLDEHPSRLPGWDSLAALRFLVALEELAGRSLPEREVAAAPDVAALVALLEA